MKLVASLIVKDEADRYLENCIWSLLDFCDEIRVFDDGSRDGTVGILTQDAWGERVKVSGRPHSTFYQHEGYARQDALDWALRANPDWLLAIDADEFIADGRQLRKALTRSTAAVVTLRMQEIWCADEDVLCVREDGGWREHQSPVCYQPSALLAHELRIADRQLACGRVPPAVVQRHQRAMGEDSMTEILHFGWANPEARAARHARYVEHDQGRFHASAHLASIMWPDAQVTLRPRPWPPGLRKFRRTILLTTGLVT
jgi:glycosyltransferase involved in cell wall biosynthesis